VDVELELGCDAGTYHINDPLDRKLLAVETGHAASDEHVVLAHFNFQPPNPPSGSFYDPVLHGLFEIRRPWQSLLLWVMDKSLGLPRPIAVYFARAVPPRSTVGSGLLL
jgi:hypothetical protein